jgi:hypothetical protein
MSFFNLFFFPFLLNKSSPLENDLINSKIDKSIVWRPIAISQNNQKGKAGVLIKRGLASKDLFKYILPKTKRSHYWSYHGVLPCDSLSVLAAGIPSKFKKLPPLHRLHEPIDQPDPGIAVLRGDYLQLCSV